MNRRHFVKALCALVAASALRPLAARAQEGAIFFADMHSHIGILGGRADVREAMANNRMLVIARKIVADAPVIRRTAQGVKQMRESAPGELGRGFDTMLERIRSEHKEQGLTEITSVAALDRVITNSERAIVLAAEGADFLEGDRTRLQRYRELGVVHVQLVHYRQNEVGDISTERPIYEGLSAMGKALVADCNRLGILVDLAHATSNGIAQALEISTKPMIYSHGHVTSDAPYWTYGATRARAIHRPLAQRIAEKGGVIGIWPLGSQYRTLDAYAGALLDAIDTLGADHVGIGSDMFGLPSSVIPSYAEFAALEELLAKRGFKPDDTRKVLGGNYLRVLRDTLAPK